MFSSTLFRRIFFGVLAIVFLYSIGIYFFSVPLIKSTVAGTEERAAKTILDNVYELVKSEYRAIEAYRSHALDAYKRQLKNIALIEESFIEKKYEQFRSGALTEAEAKRSALEETRSFRYGNNDYLWVSDYDSVLISHPDPKLHNADFSKVEDIYGNFIVPPMVEIARREGEGYTTYWWRRLGEDRPTEKLTYSRDFPPWKWVVGTGVYIDDVEAEVARRKEKMILDLRQTLRGIPIARTGYLYIFDSNLNMIIHPNSNIENTNFSDLLNPVTGRSIGEELVEAARGEDSQLYYKWDRPDDKGNYVYDKLSWVGYFEPFDWYIASSIYTDELSSEANRLRNRILTVSLFTLLLAIWASILFLNHILKRLSSLSAMTSKVRDGDLSVRWRVEGDDEISMFGATLNDMVDRLRSSIHELDDKVKDRTCELDEKNEKLQAEIAERIRVEEELQQAKDYLENVIENSPDAIGIVDRKGAFIKWNRRAVELYGYGFEELKGKSAGDLYSSAEEEKEIAEDLRREGFVQRSEIDMKHKDGSIVPFEISISLIRDGEGRSMGSVCVARDLTKMKQTLSALQQEVVERARAEDAHRESENRYRTIFENTGNATVIVAEDGIVSLANTELVKLSGHVRTEIEGVLPWRDFFEAEDVERIGALQGGSSRGSEGAPRSCEARLRCENGQFRDTVVTVARVPETGESVLSLVDITERKQAEEALRDSHRKLEQQSYEISQLNEMGDMLQLSRDLAETYGIIHSYLQKLFPGDSGVLFVFNHSRTVLEPVVSWGEGMESASEFSQKDCWALRRGRLHAVEDPSTGVLCRHVQDVLEGGYFCVPMIAQGEVLGLFHLRPESVRETPEENRRPLMEGKKRLAMMLGEHTAMAMANLNLRETLRLQSIRDPLTGLYNRRYMEESLEREAYRAMRRGTPLGIAMLDIDHFKRFNDTHGHEAGDLILAEVGGLLKENVRREDIACRYGGEEFTLILPECSMDQLWARAEELRERVKRIRVRYRHQLLENLTISLGVAVFPDHGATFQDVLNQADAALYHAKKTGRDRTASANTQGFSQG